MSVTVAVKNKEFYVGFSASDRNKWASSKALCLRCGDNPPFLAGMAKLNLQYILQKANK
jgi:hypothetical protein